MSSRALQASRRCFTSRWHHARCRLFADGQQVIIRYAFAALAGIRHFDALFHAFFDVTPPPIFAFVAASLRAAADAAIATTCLRHIIRHDFARVVTPILAIACCRRLSSWLMPMRCFRHTYDAAAAEARRAVSEISRAMNRDAATIRALILLPRCYAPWHYVMRHCSPRRHAYFVITPRRMLLFFSEMPLPRAPLRTSCLRTFITGASRC